MYRKKHIRNSGFTLIELIIATFISVIVISGVGILMVDSQKGWNKMYDRAYGDVVTSSYVARAKFDSITRSADWEKYDMAEDGSWLEVYYYEDANSTVVDRYAKFSYDGSSELDIEYGQLDPRQTLSISNVCGNVTYCVFKTQGRSVQMILTLDDGSQSATVASSAVMHN
jgi:prepilin-type N-terminal cleavage/methylation domain-containing protein